METMNEDLARTAYEAYQKEMEKRPNLVPTFLWSWEDVGLEMREVWGIVAEKVKQHKVK